MKKNLKLLGLALLGLLLGGCLVQSIHPLFTEADYIPVPRLAGVWKQQDEKGNLQGIWQFEEKGPAYRLKHTDEKGRVAVFQVAAGKIGTNVFLDFCLDDPSPDNQLNDLAVVHLIPAHVFFKQTWAGDNLVLATMDLDWLAKHLEQNPQTAAHVFSEKMPLLTASTADLKKFIARHADDGKVFKNELKIEPRHQSK